MPQISSALRTRMLLEKYDFHFQKRYGQNFLINDGVLRGIVEAAGVEETDCVLEIGPGIGTMTEYLAEAARKVIAVEIDDKLIPILEDSLSAYKNIRIIHGDVLKVDLNKIVEEENDGCPIKVVANLPYYITTPIIMELLESGLPIHSITIMVQKEVADRMIEGPGSKDYGALSLAVQYYAKPEVAMEVPPSSFVPPPGVSSSVIHLGLYREKPVTSKNEKLMFNLIRASFNQRRKTLMNGLSNGMGWTLTKDDIGNVLTAMELPLTIRGEALTLAQFAELADRFDEILSK